MATHTANDSETLDRLERDALTRINAIRHRLGAQLGAAGLAVTRAAQHYRAGRLEQARTELQEAAGLMFAATEQDEPVRALLALVEGRPAHG